MSVAAAELIHINIRYCCLMEVSAIFPVLFSEGNMVRIIPTSVTCHFCLDVGCLVLDWEPCSVGAYESTIA